MDDSGKADAQAGDTPRGFTVTAVFDDNDQGYAIWVDAPDAAAAVAMVEAPNDEGFTSRAVSVFVGDVAAVWVRDV